MGGRGREHEIPSKRLANAKIYSGDEERPILSGGLQFEGLQPGVGLAKEVLPA
jgi:hypothetical protein